MMGLLTVGLVFAVFGVVWEEYSGPAIFGLLVLWGLGAVLVYAATCSPENEPTDRTFIVGLGYTVWFAIVAHLWHDTDDPIMSLFASIGVTLAFCGGSAAGSRRD